MNSIFSFLLGRGKVRAAVRYTESPGLDGEVRSVIEALRIFPREANDDGPRVAVYGLRGAFIYSRDEAQRRLCRTFPELAREPGQLQRAIRFLESRVAMAATPKAAPQRTSWVHGWRNEAGNA